MFKTAAAYTSESDSAAAGRDLGRQVLEQLENRLADAVVVFASARFDYSVLLTGAAPPTSPARPAAPARRAQTPAGRPGGGGALTGSIYVDSRPSGARILLDGRPAGKTPARMPDITIGSHVVRLELTDHRPWTVSTRVAAGEETRVTGSLERIP